ncbi:uncharacterized protein LAJ45_05497 [Morchella importuna]|uniref:uncharacterized protein n=1 Tax=Morchella importuna TaxID=1174673 RepID=UPI001E8C9E59|nr:uncharacterized protein LAJ45_05497 [Morchella importuna]KAH8150286.1 hypothetical protein LAJ45_05497 [Morchella importuna]
MGASHSKSPPHRRPSFTRSSLNKTHTILTHHIVKYSDTFNPNQSHQNALYMETTDVSNGKVQPVNEPLRLHDLPNELFLVIGDELSDPPDSSALYSLMLTSHRFNSLLKPHLLRLALRDHPDGTPPLHFAAAGSYTALFLQLLEKIPEEDLNREDSKGCTALHVALDHDRTDFTIARALINIANVDIDARNKLGETPLKLAVSRGYEGMVALLLARGADVHIRDTKDQTVLHIATRNWGNGGSTAIAERLLKASIDVDARNNLGETALHKAVLFAHTDMVRLLLDWRADTSIADNWWGGTPLHWAADMGKAEIGKLLLESGAAVGARDVFKGGTPFHWAAKRPSEAMLRLLLREGADVKSVDNFGKRAVDWIVRQERRRGMRDERIIGELLTTGSVNERVNDRGRDWHLASQDQGYTLAALYCFHFDHVRNSARALQAEDYTTAPGPTLGR